MGFEGSKRGEAGKENEGVGAELAAEEEEATVAAGAAETAGELDAEVVEARVGLEKDEGPFTSREALTASGETVAEREEDEDNDDAEEDRAETADASAAEEEEEEEATAASDAEEAEEEEAEEEELEAAEEVARGGEESGLGGIASCCC